MTDNTQTADAQQVPRDHLEPFHYVIKPLREQVDNCPDEVSALLRLNAYLSVLIIDKLFGAQRQQRRSNRS